MPADAPVAQYPQHWEADVILHARDIASEESEAEAEDVRTVLDRLGVDVEERNVIEVWNKADLLDPAERERQLGIATLRPDGSRPALVSALTGEGVGRLEWSGQGRGAAVQNRNGLRPGRQQKKRRNNKNKIRREFQQRIAAVGVQFRRGS